MSRLFFLPASRGKAAEHLEQSIRSGVPLSVARPLPGDVRSEIEAHAVRGQFHAWGAQPGDQNPNTWAKLAVDDIALVYQQGSFPYAARVYAKAQSKEVAEAIWGRERNRTWEYMYFLDSPRAVDIPLARVANAFGYGPNWMPRGFSFPSETARDVMIAKYGSAAGFLEAMTNGSVDFDGIADAPDAEEITEIIEEATSGSSVKGQGWQRSVKVRKAIEDHAMKIATKHFRKKGWKVEDVSGTQSYDLKATRSRSHELRIEVKGTTSLGEKVILTKNEVKHAKRVHPHMALVVVSEITVSGSESRPRCSGGSTNVIDPWDVRLGQLTSLAYTYKLP